ncbi:hypothetical protein THAOC_07533, partial [Thalassiosira oceanica]
ARGRVGGPGARHAALVVLLVHVPVQHPPLLLGRGQGGHHAAAAVRGAGVRAKVVVRRPGAELQPAPPAVVIAASAVRGAVAVRGGAAIAAIAAAAHPLRTQQLTGRINLWRRAGHDRPRLDISALSGGAAAEIMRAWSLGGVK